MAQNTSLDEFLGVGEADEESESGENSEPESDTEPAVSTYAWEPDGACEDCGEAVERRWRDGEQLVCAECKSW